MFKWLLLFLLAAASAGCSPRSEEVTLPSGEVSLAATLYLPGGGGPHPAVVLIPGSGPFVRENFRGLAEFFAGRGVAALVYDKRTSGAAGGGAVSFEELTADAQAAVRLLEGRGDINPAKVGLWGGSEGAGVAAEVAARSGEAAARTGRVAFLVSVSGGGVTYAELVLYQLANRLRAQGRPEDEIREATSAVRQLHEYVRAGGDAAAVQAALDRAWRHEWAAGALPRRVPTAEEIASSPQWRDLDGDPVKTWERVRVPVLAFWGESDEFVPVGPSAARIGEALRRAGNRDVTLKVIRGADHQLNRASGPSTSDEYLKTMIDWIRRTLDETRHA